MMEGRLHDKRGETTPHSSKGQNKKKSGGAGVSARIIFKKARFQK